MFLPSEEKKTKGRHFSTNEYVVAVVYFMVKINYFLFLKVTFGSRP